MIRSTVLSATLAAASLMSGQAMWGQAPTGPVMIAVQSGSYLGVGVIEVNENSAKRVGLSEPRGVEVANVAKSSPADQAGLRPGDVVTSFLGQTVLGVEHFVRLVRETPVGREVEMEVVSQDGVRSLTATIGQRKPMFARVPAPRAGVRMSEPVDVDIPRPTMLVRSRSLGATLEGIDGAFARFFGVAEGVLVRAVDPGEVAARAGLQTGDVIVAIEGSTVRQTSDVRMELSRADGEKARMDVVRGKARRQLEIETGRRTFTRPFEGARQVSRPN